MITDMGDRPDGHTIDRINPRGDYCPENCRWATWDIQAKNRGSFNRIITYKGKTQCLKDWAKEYGIHYQTLVARVKNFPQLSFEEILHYCKEKSILGMSFARCTAFLSRISMTGNIKGGVWRRFLLLLL